MIEQEFENRNPYCALSKVVAGPKRLNLTSKFGEKLSFERGVSHDGHPDFSITATIQSTTVTTEKCSLGHDHEVKKKGEFKMCSINMTWDQAQSLIDWFSNGTWKEVRDARKKQNGPEI